MSTTTGSPQPRRSARPTTTGSAKTTVNLFLILTSFLYPYKGEGPVEAPPPEVKL